MPVLPAKSQSSQVPHQRLTDLYGIFLQHPSCAVSHITGCPTNSGENTHNCNVAIGERITEEERKATAEEKAGFTVLHFQGNPRKLNIYIFLAYSSNPFNSTYTPETVRLLH